MRRFVGVLLAAVFSQRPRSDAARLVRVAGGFDMSIYATKRFGSLYVVEQDGQIWRKSPVRARFSSTFAATFAAAAKRACFPLRPTARTRRIATSTSTT